MKKKLDLNESTEDIEAFWKECEKNRKLKEEQEILEAEKERERYLKELISMNVVIGSSPQKISITREELCKAIIASGVLDELYQVKREHDFNNMRF